MTDPHRMKILFQCPVCPAFTEGNEEFHIVTSNGANYWCCSPTCCDIALTLDNDLPYANLQDEIDKDN